MNWSEKFNANISVDDPTLIPYTSRTREHQSTKNKRNRAEFAALTANIKEEMGDAEVVDSSSSSGGISIEEKHPLEVVEKNFTNTAIVGEEAEGTRFPRLRRAGGVLVSQDRSKGQGKGVKRQLDSSEVHHEAENPLKEEVSSALISPFIVASKANDGEENMDEGEGKIDGKMKDAMEVKTLKGREYGNTAGFLILLSNLIIRL